jgi:hypothetical protein
MAFFDADLLAGALPNYEIGKEVGRGGWGIVFEARHRQLDRTVAIKELPRAFAADPAVRRRFLSEARLLASLEHPHIVPIYDYVEHEGLCLLIMELLPGGTVWQRFTGEGMTPQATCGIVLAACTALEYAHAAGVLHRDIKPENLLFTANGTVKVSDYGIAKVIGETRTMATRTGEVLGTPAYMAPEQALGSELTPATDIYALSVLTYELLSGTLPFPDDGNVLGLLYRRVHDQPTPLTQSGPQVPAQLANAVMHALETDPADRPASAEAFGLELADACNVAWGPGWAQASGITLRAPGAIADRLSGPQHTAIASASAPSERPAVRGSGVAATIIERPSPVETPVEDSAPQDAQPDESVRTNADVKEGDQRSKAPVAPPVPNIEATRAEPRGRSLVRTSVLTFTVILVIGGVVAFLAFGSGGGGSEATRSVTRVAVPGTVQWTDTGVTLNKGDEVTITATGSVFGAQGGAPAGPDGYVNQPDLHQYNAISEGDHAGLIAKVAVAGTAFVVGASRRFTSDSDGQLFLGINDRGVDNNSGEFVARVSVKRP